MSIINGFNHLKEVIYVRPEEKKFWKAALKIGLFIVSIIVGKKLE